MIIIHSCVTTKHTHLTHCDIFLHLDAVSNYVIIGSGYGLVPALMWTDDAFCLLDTRQQNKTLDFNHNENCRLHIVSHIVQESVIRKHVNLVMHPM